MGSILDDARRIVELALDQALPARCVGCYVEGSPLCARCRPALDARHDVGAGWPIGMPVELPAPLVQVEWCAPYTGVVRSAVHALKYRGERRLARPLGAALARRWARAGAGGEVLVPVPVHATRLADRGYDQAVLLAAAAGEGLGLPVRPVLVRRRATARQFDLDRDRRAANVGGAFACATGAGPIVTGRWVILVDDVLTTGATAAACATTLLAGGALAVSLVAVARER